MAEQTWDDVKKLLAASEDAVATPLTFTEQRPAESLHGSFAKFDPRVDGLSAIVGARWAASDCPVRMRCVGPGKWSLDGVGNEPALLACLAPAEVNALCQGFARQPTKDFTPEHVLTPDAANNRFTDTGPLAQHLTRVGATASIAKSPFFDASSAFGQQAQQVDQQASYYAAANAGQYDIANEDFVVAVVASFSADGGGGLYLSKCKQGGANKGYGMSVNADKGFGFLTRGAVAELNNDAAQYNADVVDRRVRVFFLGRTTTGLGLAFVYTPEFGSVAVAGLAGSLTSADGVFGLLSDSGVGQFAASTSQTQKIIFWRGAAATNVISYVGALGAQVQAQLGRAAVAAAVITTPVSTTPNNLPSTDADFAKRTNLAAAWWRFDLANSGNVASLGQVAGTLVAAGAPTYQKLVSGEPMVTFPGATGDALSADILNVAANSFLFAARVALASIPGALGTHMQIGRVKAGVHAIGWALFATDAGDLKYNFDDGVNTFSGTLAAALIPPGSRPLDIVGNLDRSGANPTLFVRWCRGGVLLGNTQVVMAGLGSLFVAGQEFGFGAIPVAAPVFNGGGAARFGAVAIGATTVGRSISVSRGLGFEP
jgi:hypothetical protein